MGWSLVWTSDIEIQTHQLGNCEGIHRQHRPWGTRDYAFRQGANAPGGERETGHVCRRVSCYCKTSAAQWNPSNINSPQARKQTWRHRVWVWKKGVWGVKEMGMAFLPLKERAQETSSHPDSFSVCSVKPQSHRLAFPWSQNLSSGTNRKLSRSWTQGPHCWSDINYLQSSSDFSSHQRPQR